MARLDELNLKAETVEAGPSFDELPDPDELIDAAEPSEPSVDDLEQSTPPKPIGAPEPGPEPIPAPPAAEPGHSGDTAASPSIAELGEGDDGQVEVQRTGEQQQVAPTPRPDKPRAVAVQPVVIPPAVAYMPAPAPQSPRPDGRCSANRRA